MSAEKEGTGAFVKSSPYSTLNSAEGIARQCLLHLSEQNGIHLHSSGQADVEVSPWADTLSAFDNEHYPCFLRKDCRNSGNSKIEKRKTVPHFQRRVMTSNNGNRRKLHFVNSASEKSEVSLKNRYTTVGRYNEEVSKSIDVSFSSKALNNMTESVNEVCNNSFVMGYKRDKFNCLAIKDKLQQRRSMSICSNHPVVSELQNINQVPSKTLKFHTSKKELHYKKEQKENKNYDSRSDSKDTTSKARQEIFRKAEFQNILTEVRKKNEQYEKIKKRILQNRRKQSLVQISQETQQLGHRKMPGKYFREKINENEAKSTKKELGTSQSALKMNEIQLNNPMGKHLLEKYRVLMCRNR